MTFQFPDPLPNDQEERLTHLLELWAKANRLSTADAHRIREAVQMQDGWEQDFWTRMSMMLISAPAIVRHIPEQSWGLILPDLAQITNTPGFRPYLRVSS